MFVYFKIIMWNYRTLEMNYFHHPALEKKTTCWTGVQIFFSVYTVLHIELWVIYLNEHMIVLSRPVFICIFIHMYMCMCLYVYARVY